MINICYWPGREKKGQFPPDFGRRDSIRGAMTNTQQKGSKQRPTINKAMTEDANDKEVLAFITMGNTDYEVITTSLLYTPTFPDKSSFNSFNATSGQGYENLGVQENNGGPDTNLIMLNSVHNNLTNIPTLIDSGASDHCFVNKEYFITLILLSQLMLGLGVGKGSTFNVIGKEKAKIYMNIDGNIKSLTFDNVLYTPKLR